MGESGKADISGIEEPASGFGRGGGWGLEGLGWVGGGGVLWGVRFGYFWWSCSKAVWVACMMISCGLWNRELVDDFIIFLSCF